MNTKITLKKIICFLLALAMILGVVGCAKETKKKKRKVVVKKKVVVVNDDEGNKGPTNSYVDPDDSYDEEQPSNNNNNDNKGDTNKTEEPTLSPRTPRDLPQVEAEEKLVPFDSLHTEVFTPEFTSTNVDFANLADYTIVYSVDRTADGVATNTGSLAYKLQQFFKDKDGVDLPVYKDSAPEASAAAKKILVGDTAFYTSALPETQYAVKVDGDNLVFEGGHHVMVEKAVDWFRTVERVDGKIATLTGKQDDFKSSLTLDGQKYVYVWGDEFDGVEKIDNSKWNIGTHMPQWSDLEYIKNDDVVGVKNGRLKFTGIRWKSETDNKYGFATSGSVDTENTLAYKAGYFEWTAKLSYKKGTLPAYWLMQNPETGLMIPRSQYAAPWTVEHDMLEIFALPDQYEVSLHKYYKPYKQKAASGRTYDNGITLKADTINNDDGTTTTIPHTYYNTIEVSDKINQHEKNWAAHGLITSYRNYVDNSSDFRWTWDSSKVNTLNDEYHTYGYLFTGEKIVAYVDGEKWHEVELKNDIDTFDGFDFDNNNGFSYDLWSYVIMNQHLYTPGSYDKGFPLDKHVNTAELPISSYVDNVRLYQLPAEQYVISPGLNDFGSFESAEQKTIFFEDFDYSKYETEYNTWR